MAAFTLAIAGCGSSSAGSQEVSGVTATNGVIAPPGGPYSYRVPAGWHALARIEVGDPSSKAHARSAVARGRGLISVVASPRRSGDPHRLASAYVAGLAQEGVHSRLVGLGAMDRSTAFTLAVSNVPVPGGGRSAGLRTLLFAPRDLILISCQWVDRQDRREVLRACADVQKSMKLTSS